MYDRHCTPSPLVLSKSIIAVYCVGKKLFLSESLNLYWFASSLNHFIYNKKIYLANTKNKIHSSTL
jgi:hypothetical protein